MKKINTKLLALLTSLFVLDLIKPLGYSLAVEFVFLGVIFVSLNEDLLSALGASAILGLLCDSFNPGMRPICLIEFPLICLLNNYLFSHFRFVSKQTRVFIIKNSLVLLALIIHIIINSIRSSLFLPFFWIKFLIQSLLIYFLITYFIGKDKCIHSFGISQ
ncbi:MAG: hypothetical protein P9M02_06060 [Candidatus Susulua stagnicola]|nr:hypothetical protein [Candidatus Susulua stagnicola]